MARNFRNGDYCGLAGFLTGMCFDSDNESRQTQIQVQEPTRPVNVTININLGKDENFSYKDLIKSIVEQLR